MITKVGPRCVSAPSKTSAICESLSIFSARVPKPAAMPGMSKLGLSKSMPTNRVYRKETSAIADKTHGVLAGRETNPDTKRHGPAQTSAAWRKMDIPKAEANRHVLHDCVFGRALGNDVRRPIEVSQHAQYQGVARAFAGRRVLRFERS